MNTELNPVLLAFGQFRRGDKIRLCVAAQQALLEPRFSETTINLIEQLEGGAAAIVFDAAALQAGEVCSLARSHPQGRYLPIISGAGELVDLAFAHVVYAGGDDAVQPDGYIGFLDSLYGPKVTGNHATGGDPWST